MFSDPWGLKAHTCPPCIAEAEAIAAIPIPGARQLGTIAGLAFAAWATVKGISEAKAESERVNEGGVTVRLQAQGGGIEESVVINSGAQGMVGGADGIRGLGLLQSKIGGKEAAQRWRAFERATRYILEAMENGGTSSSKSFTNGPGTDVRIDVEVLRGTAFVTPQASDAVIQ